MFEDRAEILYEVVPGKPFTVRLEWSEYLLMYNGDYSVFYMVCELSSQVQNYMYED